MKIKRIIIHGLALGGSVAVWSLLTQIINSTNSLVGIVSSVLFVSIYVGVILSLVKDMKVNDRSTYWSLLLTGVLGSCIISLCYFLLATVINPSHIQDQVMRSQQQWSQLNYSAEQIKSQVEMTETFQNPVKWSFVLFGFNLGVFLVVGLVMIGIKYLRKEFRNENQSPSLNEEIS